MGPFRAPLLAGMLLLALSACGAADENVGSAAGDAAEAAADMAVDDCFAEGALSDFPWPPPQYSVAQTVPRATIFGMDQGVGASLDDVALRLIDGLDVAGYSEKAFYGVGCDGFAIVTRLEQIGADGSPVDGATRFDPPDQDRPFSLADYITQLFYAPPGFYRQITFVVTPRDIVGDGSRVAEDTLDALLEEGADTLPDSFGRAPFTAGHSVTALIYEFSVSGNQAPEAIVPGRIPGTSHLSVSGILAGLAGQQGG